MTGNATDDPVTVIRNIGPSLAKVLEKAGIRTAGQLRNIGAHEAYRRLLKSGVRPHFITYYVLHMALQGRPWNDCKGAEKDALRIDFDTLKRNEAGSFSDTEFERMLSDIGIVRR